MSGLEAKHIASYIDHTYLKPDASTSEIGLLCAEAKQHGFYSVCVNGSWVPYCAQELAGSEVQIAAVVGFPLGAGCSEAKAFEAAAAVKQGASEIDMVLNIGWLLEGRYDDVRADIRAVADAVQGKALLKVIIETGFLNEEQKRAACKLSEEAGAHYVKTSTGFGPGGATVADVALMRASVSPAIGVKASGGVRDYETAMKMIAAGASRIGTSSGVSIVTGAAREESGSY